ncbi:E3 ubiquitin-protein ligase TRIM71-like [Exaiptasia diaphana]|uniref:E3 ubiquitin-protein ligase TRIM71-like n=1 Tax=Exaiptasia diaphana TaxID=2652724 RepID=A0A913XPZ5_EXADI|nr:E3 ubiquitin-protein ligase TRIM71-like [Exaiptasia diaphana]
MKSFVEDLKLQVQCSLCNETMFEPKLLQCFHTFCKTCIKTNAQLDDQVNIFKCPQCDSSTELKELNDVEDLEISPIHSRILQVLSFVENQKVCSISASHSDALWRCLDCDRSLCEDCLRNHSTFIKDHKVVALSEMTKENVELMFKKKITCKEHTNQDNVLHCQDCNEFVCLLCLRDHHHNDHKITSLQEFITAKKDSLSKNLEEIEKMHANEEEKKQQEQIAIDINRDGEKAQKQVKELTKKLVKKITDQEQELLNEIQLCMTKADRNLRILRHTPAAQEYIKYLIQSEVVSGMFDMRSHAEYLETFIYKTYEKDIGGIKFKPNKLLCEQIDTGLGLVQDYKKVDPKMSLVNSNPLYAMYAMNKEKLTVTLRTYKGELCDPPLDDVTIHMTPEDDVRVGENQVTMDDLIGVNFTPLVPGQLTAEVKVHGNPVSNSPLVINIQPQRIQNKTVHPKLHALNIVPQDLSGIAVNKSNTKIAVADRSACCVRVFNMDGDLLLSYGSEGSGRGQLKNPEGLSFLDDTDLVIADCNNHRICIVDTTSGRLVTTFGCQGNMDGQFNGPRGVHVDDDSNIIVCDYGNHRVQVFTKNGDYLYQFTIPNKPYSGPYSTIKHNGLFYVSAGSVVHVIEMKDNQSPTTVNTIGEQDYYNPRGLAIDNDNNLLVCGCSSGSEVYIKFKSDGRYVGKTSFLKCALKYLAVLNDGQIICTSDKGNVFFM